MLRGVSSVCFRSSREESHVPTRTMAPAVPEKSRTEMILAMSQDGVEGARHALPSRINYPARRDSPITNGACSWVPTIDL